MRHLLITDPCLVPSSKPGELRHADAGEILENVDDNVALSIASSGRAKMFREEEIEAVRAAAAKLAPPKPAADAPPATPSDEAKVKTK